MESGYDGRAWSYAAAMGPKCRPNSTAAPAEASGEADPGEADPGEADPGEADPGEADPGEADPGDEPSGD
jgi:hypothetical protein